MIFLICLLIIIWVLFINRMTKQDIADYYGITRKTLNKWIWHISNKICHNSYKKARKLSGWMTLQIIATFGFVEDQKPLYKNAIKAMCETNYRTIRENISEPHCGISLETYISMNVFPPVISSRLVNHLGL